MATKKKAAVKKAAKKKAANKNAAKLKPAQVLIQADGTPNPASIPLDGNGKKHPSKVYWQAADTTIAYQIVLPSAPLPFKNGNGPFPTNASGKTKTLTADKKDPNGNYPYIIQAKTRGRWTQLSGGGIIIDG